MKKNNILFLVLTFIFISILSSCIRVVDIFTITWKNEDGTVLEVDQNVTMGTLPTYDGETPTKEGSAEFTYTFAGWSPSVQVVERSATYFATYTQTVNTYTITWLNEDGTVLEIDEEVVYGTLPTYDKGTPVKEVEGKEFVFVGWTPSVTNVVGDASYKALFEEVVAPTCKVTWLNYDGTILEVDEGVLTTETNHTYDGSTPTKESDKQYTYIFSKWNKTIDEVTLDVTYTAEYVSSLNSYTVTWKNYDNSILEVDEEVLYGTLPSYEGSTPLKDGFEGVTYIFIGWDKEIDKVECDITYIAVFSESTNTYTVTWKNEDGTVLEVDSEVLYGTTPSYDGNIPTKEGNEGITYSFVGWDKEIDKVEGDITYIAVFTESTNTYKVVWKNYDGTILEVDSEVLYGTLPSYDGNIPTKEENAQYIYIFNGWTPEVNKVVKDVEYVATYLEDTNKYTVTWKNEDGTVLEVDEDVLYGMIPSYDATLPSKEGDAQYTYTFASWTPEIKEVGGNITYTAVYTQTINTYTVTWINEDGTVLEVDEDVVYGTLPTYDGSLPIKEGNNQYSYIFNGWTPEVDTVTNDVTYIANFQQEINKYTITWKNEDGIVLEVDSEVLYGTLPSYNGSTPLKEGNAKYTYTFASWTPEIKEVEGNVIYIATYSYKVNTYIVTWIDDNEDVLEIDEEVLYGTLPNYDGNIPTKEGFIFKDWTPTISSVEGNVTYKAVYKAKSSEVNVPVVSTDKKTVEYGLYPQTHVNDAALILELNKLSASDVNGWYLYNNEYYAKIIATVFNDEEYKFDDGTTIVNGQEYWFKCEAIVWDVLSNEDGTYYLLSNKLLDVQKFYNAYGNRTDNDQIVYANNYEQSDIRKWLNNEFYNTVFALGEKYVNNTTVDNGANTTNLQNNEFACLNTVDKVYLPSYKDLLNGDYGFEVDGSIKSSTRISKTTDYARAKGAWCNIKTSDVGTDSLYCGTYWTRSPSSEYYYCAWNVNSGGYLSSYAVDGNSHCVRPCISITID